MKKFVILKLIGLVLLTMICLVLISFLEVAVYSYMINPGQDVSVYDAHAELTAPYISGVFGFLVFFLVVRYWKKKGYQNVFKLMLLFPTVYVLMDILVLLLAGFDQWSDYFLIIILANGAKFLGSFLGYKLTK